MGFGGAHYGIHTLGFARRVGPRGQVAAFEPAPVSFHRLQFHLRMNRLKNVVAFPAAASERTAEQTLLLDRGVGATTSHLPYPGGTTEPDQPHTSDKHRPD